MGCRMCSSRVSAAGLPSTACRSAGRSTAPLRIVPGNAASIARIAPPPFACSRCTAASASNTGMRARRNAAAAVDLPIPMPPVRPMILTPAAGPPPRTGAAPHRPPDQRRTRRGTRAQPGAQHPEALDAAQSARPGGGEQRGFQRHINDVHHCHARRRAVQIDLQRRISGHPQRCRVDQQRMAGKRGVAAFPIDDPQSRQVPGQRIGMGARPVGERDINAETQQRRADGPRRAPGAQDQGRTGGWIDAVGADVFQEAPAIGVAADDAAVLEDQRVDRPGAVGGFVHRVADRERRDLVRDGAVDAGEPGPHQARGSPPESAPARSAAAHRRRRCRSGRARSRAGGASGNGRRASR